MHLMKSLGVVTIFFWGTVGLNYWIGKLINHPTDRTWAIVSGAVAVAALLLSKITETRKE